MTDTQFVKALDAVAACKARYVASGSDGAWALWLAVVQLIAAFTDGVI